VLSVIAHTLGACSETNLPTQAGPVHGDINKTGAACAGIWNYKKIPFENENIF